MVYLFLVPMSKVLTHKCSDWGPTMSWRLVQRCTLPLPKCSWDRLTIAHDPERENKVKKEKINKKILNPAPISVLLFSLNVGPMALL